MKAMGCVLLAAVALATSAGSASAPGRIVFAAHDTTAYGEIYRVTQDGAKVDLSNSPAADLAPAVSPDGRTVAFVTTRGGRARVLLVGVDGKGLRSLSPPLFRVPFGVGVVPQLAWSPDGRRVAVDLSTSKSVYVAAVAGGWRRIARGSVGASIAWSPDSRFVAIPLEAALVGVYDPQTGARVWTTSGISASWSRDGRLAVEDNSYTTTIFTAAGVRLASFQGATPQWSPDGRLLGSVRGARLEIRRDGVGKPTLSVKLWTSKGGWGFSWLSPTTLTYSTPSGADRGYDVVHERTFTPMRRGAYVTYASGTVSLHLGVHVVATAASCHDDPAFEDLQAAAGGVVYQTGCVPSDDLFSVAPDGSDMRRLTSTPQHEFNPALSPDGTRVAYDEQDVASRCDGCPQSLWRTSPTTQLTSPAYSDDAPFDDNPSWSSDGTTIVFSRSGANISPGLMTVPAAGGTPRSLHVQGGDAVWGPSLIAFVPWNSRTPELDTLDPATGAIRTVASGLNANVGGIAWTSDGRLAYLNYTPTNHAEIVVAGADRTPIDVTPLFPSGTRVIDLAASPDGGRFAFVATDANGVGEIYTIRDDGTGLTQVTKDPGVELFVSSIDWR